MPKRTGDPRQARRARLAEQERRARMYLHAHLGWLTGFPDAAAPAGGALRWWRLDDGAATVIDRPMLARARRALRTLLGEHAEALAGEVGDVARWSAAATALLDGLGDAVHRGGAVSAAAVPLEPAAARVARALIAAEPLLAPAVDAATIALATQPESRLAALRWITGEVEALARLVAAAPGPRGVLAVLRLAGLAADEGAAAVAPLVALAGTAAVTVSVATNYGRELANRLEKGGVMAPPPPLALSTATVIDWLPRLVAADRATRRRVLGLFALVDLAPPLDAARRWWTQLQPQLTRAAAMTTHPLEDGVGDAMAASVRAELARAPKVFDLVEWLRTVEEVAEPAGAAYHGALRRLTAMVPAAYGPIARFALLESLAEFSVRDDSAARVAWLCDALADEIDGGAPVERMLAPWRLDPRETSAGYPRGMVVASIRRADARRVAALLAACASRGDVSALLVGRLLAFVALSIPPARVADILDAAARLKNFHDQEQIQAAVAIGGADVEDVVAALEALGSIENDLPYRASAELAALAGHVGASDAGWVLRYLIDHKQVRAVCDAAAVAAVLPRRQWPPFATGLGPAAWLDGYPEVLRPALVRLAATDPAAEATARRVLRRDLPHPDDAARELAALRGGRGKSASAAGRVNRLERGSKPPSAVRLARLSGQLERVAAQVALDRFAATVTQRATDRIATAAGLPAWPDWPLDRTRIAVLASLAKLPPRPRELASRLLRRRAGPPPWDLRDDPRNVAYLDGLRRRGIDPAPWLDDTVHAVKGADGTPLTLGFTGDPLEVFAMGEHFSTCLAPDGHNFFSVVTNAADVNKRVAYVRRADGVVAGRCLFALTDAGRLLTFTVYAHDGKHDLETIVRDFAVGLAARMHTEIIGAGPVSTLLADDWYDDGATDLTDRFAALASGSPLRVSLAALPLAEIPAALVAALGRPLDDIVLPLVVALAELNRRPAIITVLGPYLLASPAISDPTMFAAARHAVAAGDHALADRLIGTRARASHLSQAPRWLGDVLAVVRPSQALMFLRATRERGVHGWDDEPVERQAIAALALENLRRPRQAAALYRLAIRHGWKGIVDELRPRLHALEARAGTLA